MRLFVPKKYILQHKILERTGKSPTIDGKTIFPTIDELTDSLKTNRDYILKAIHTLEKRDCIHIGDNLVYLAPNGKNTYFQESILDEGWEKFKSDFLRWTQISGIITASIISISTFLSNVLSTKTNSKDIQELQKEMQFLKGKLEHVQDSIKYSKNYQPTRNSLKKP